MRLMIEIKVEGRSIVLGQRTRKLPNNRVTRSVAALTTTHVPSVVTSVLSARIYYHVTSVANDPPYAN